jgi:hypothetical protein
MAPATLNLHNFARRYTAAWCSQNAASVAACYSPNGALSINGGTPAIGRNAITAAAQEFMSAFPDLQVFMDNLDVQDDGAIYHWTLIGTNTGTGGKGQHVRISGFEVWKLSPDGLIDESRGNFDATDYQRQLERT